jgi:pimeloyl-ACP methyl ester carboxylesterase
MWSQPWVWDNWKTRFEERGYTCIALTLPAHGESAPDSALETLGILDYSAAVERAARQYDRPVLIGHSLGGLIAQQVAARLRLSAAVLVNSAVPAPIFPLRPIMLPGLIRHFMGWGLWRKPFRLSRWEANFLLFNEMSACEQKECYDRLIGESGRIAYELGFGNINWTGSNRVDREAIRCPMLALSGTLDHIIPVSASRRMAAWYGDRLEYREHAKHAHWMLGEQDWQHRADEVLDWLDHRFPSRVAVAHRAEQASAKSTSTSVHCVACGERCADAMRPLREHPSNQKESPA